MKKEISNGRKTQPPKKPSSTTKNQDLDSLNLAQEKNPDDMEIYD